MVLQKVSKQVCGYDVKVFDVSMTAIKQRSRFHSGGACIILWGGQKKYIPLNIFRAKIIQADVGIVV